MTRETESAIKRKFAEWLKLTPEQRKEQGLPVDQKRFAIHHGVAEAKLTRWKKRMLGEVSSDDFDVKAFLSKNKKEIAENLLALIRQKKNTKSVELALKVLGELVEKREETHKVEFTPSDRVAIARQLRDELRREFQDFGVCPVCGFNKEIRHEVGVDTKPELGQDREVAAVALLAGPN
jgi:hypothetical protein